MVTCLVIAAFIFFVTASQKSKPLMQKSNKPGVYVGWETKWVKVERVSSSRGSFQTVSSASDISWISEQKNILIHFSGQVTNWGKVHRSRKGRKAPGDYTPEAGGAGALKNKKVPQLPEKTEKRSYLKQKSTAIFIRDLCTDFSSSAHSAVKLLRMRHLWPSSVSSPFLLHSPSTPLLLPLYSPSSPRRVASHVLMDLETELCQS